MFLFKSDKKKDIKDFYEAGGRPTWKEWCSWSESEKKEALEIMGKIEEIRTLIMRFSFSQDLGEKLAIADALAEYDGGELARQLRMIINQRAINEHKAINSTT